MARKPPCHRLPVGGSASSSQLAVDSAARGVPLPSAEAVLQFNKSQIMQRSLPYLVALTLGFALPQGAMAQETETPEADAPAIGEPLPGAEESDPTEAGTGAETGASDAAADEAAEDDTPATGENGETAGEDAPAADSGEAEAEAGEAADGAPSAIGEMPGTEDLPEGAPAGRGIVVRDTFGDWDVRCSEDESECALHQLGLDEQENPVIEFSLFRAPEGEEAAALVNILSPLGTFLPGGVTLQVDSGEKRQYGFTFCTAIGCIAQIALTDETVASMRRGRSAKLTLASVTAPDEPVEITLSLMGFTDGFNALEPAE